MQPLKLVTGTSILIKVGNTKIGFVRDFSINDSKVISEAKVLGSLYSVEMQYTGASVSCSCNVYFPKEFMNSVFTDIKDGKIVSTANVYNFKDKRSAEQFLLSGVNRVNLTVYRMPHYDTFAQWEEFQGAMDNPEELLFALNNCMIENESWSFNQDFVSGSLSLKSTEPVLNYLRA